MVAERRTEMQLLLEGERQVPLELGQWHIHNFLCYRNTLLAHMVTLKTKLPQPRSQDPAQLFVAISTEKRERAWYLFSRE